MFCCFTDHPHKTNQILYASSPRKQNSIVESQEEFAEGRPLVKDNSKPSLLRQCHHRRYHTSVHLFPPCSHCLPNRVLQLKTLVSKLMNGEIYRSQYMIKPTIYTNSYKFFTVFNISTNGRSNILINLKFPENKQG